MRTRIGEYLRILQLGGLIVYWRKNIYIKTPARIRRIRADMRLLLDYVHRLIEGFNWFNFEVFANDWVSFENLILVNAMMLQAKSKTECVAHKFSPFHHPNFIVVNMQIHLHILSTSLLSLRYLCANILKLFNRYLHMYKYMYSICRYIRQFDVGTYCLIVC